MLVLALLALPREGFTLHVEAGLEDVAKVHASVVRYTTDFAKQGRTFLWDLAPLKSFYRRWRQAP